MDWAMVLVKECHVIEKKGSIAAIRPIRVPCDLVMDDAIIWRGNTSDLEFISIIVMIAVLTVVN